MAVTARPCLTLTSALALSACVTAAPVVGAFVATGAQAHPAIEAFTSVCFKAGQTAAQARANMEGVAGKPLPFDLTFWDKTLEPAPGTEDHAERKCEVEFDGDHTIEAVRAVKAKMAAPPVFGTPIPTPAPYAMRGDTVFLEGRQLLRGRVAVVEIGARMDGTRTVIYVDRLPADMGHTND
ncbi:hypothetical protein [Tateyamaria sp. SN3-11]|uniref:hypothetical protein n=1 Tax=Tateyamaria sp. SN3-11 TaxID=3092147 RepID=UPI0039EB6053